MLNLVKEILGGWKVWVLIGITFIITLGLIEIQKYQNHKKDEKIDKLKTEKVVTEATNKVTQFENNQTIIIKKEKEVQDVEIDNSIGTHTINID